VRRKVGEAVKSHSIYKEEDTVVPRFELPKLLREVKAIGKRYGFRSVCYGHAGDGNLHINILKDEMSDAQWDNTLTLAIREIFELTVSLGGTLSGEHGIGWVQKNYMDIAFNEVQLNLMKKIKEAFDPNGILNPGKIFPD
jgi:glycolate oxidase